MDGPVRARSSAARRWAGTRRRSLRWQLVAVGLTAVVVHVVIVATAMAGLREVARAHREVDLITEAQRDFQDADMAHDEMLGAALSSLVQAGGGAAWAARPDASPAALRRATAHLRSALARIDPGSLPAGLAAELRDVRPEQDAYAASADVLAATVASDPELARALYPRFRQQHDALVERQGDVTDRMRALADARHDTASADETEVQRRLGASAVTALLGLLALTGVLHRLGSTVTALLARERGVAETLQHSLLPDRLPDLPGLRLAARYVPGSVGTQVGGDWYDVVLLPGGRVGLVMGDVVGHDLEAASSMGQLRNALRALAAEGAEPADVLQQLSRLCLSQGLGGIATVLYAVLDPVAGTVEIASAGHYPPLLLAPDGCRYLEAPAFPPVGAVREVRYASTGYALPAGSRLLLYTDGLVERRGAPVDDGLAQLLAVCADPSPDDLEALCDRVLAELLRDAAPDDDVALLLVAPQALLGPHVEALWPAQAERLAVLRQLLERWLAEAGADEDEVYDVVVACSEAATNAVEHAYGPGQAQFRIVCDVEQGRVTITVRDWGQWREARGQDRGRGLRLMEGLMDEVEVRHGERGTEVVLRRWLRVADRTPTGAPLSVAGST